MLQNGLALRFANAKLRDTKEVVMVAVAADGYALRFASAALTADRELVLLAAFGLLLAAQQRLALAKLELTHGADSDDSSVDGRVLGLIGEQHGRKHSRAAGNHQASHHPGGGRQQRHVGEKHQRLPPRIGFQLQLAAEARRADLALVLPLVELDGLELCFATPVDLLL